MKFMCLFRKELRCSFPFLGLCSANQEFVVYDKRNALHNTLADKPPFPYPNLQIKRLLIPKSFFPFFL